MDPDYVDVPASRVRQQCTTCGGVGAVFRPFTPSPAVETSLTVDTQADPCPDCEQHPGAASEGHVSLAAGPGAKLRRVDRVKLPGDDWPRLRRR
ncbi:hypothetical protein [Streptodolium elevatio]|uniref:Small CPxCG-related zinc finger protein n=1 Tax=Streptodolium elevatio TaxID=3157996 RepID=A0ABV3DLC5_9ACTN